MPTLQSTATASSDEDNLEESPEDSPELDYNPEFGGDDQNQQPQATEDDNADKQDVFSLFFSFFLFLFLFLFLSLSLSLSLSLLCFDGELKHCFFSQEEVLEFDDDIDFDSENDADDYDTEQAEVLLTKQEIEAIEV
jgi:hypothetical protein